MFNMFHLMIGYSPESDVVLCKKIAEIKLHIQFTSEMVIETFYQTHCKNNEGIREYDSIPQYYGGKKDTKTYTHWLRNIMFLEMKDHIECDHEKFSLSQL